MGGFAVDIDWSADPGREVIDAIADAMSHRGPAGVRVASLGAGNVAEARLHRDGAAGWEIARLGSMALVGDLRLWSTGDLSTLAPTGEVDPRLLVLHGFAALGPRVMDRIDGDFAFAIWDTDHRAVFAARDRFGVKPLWLQQTDSGIRLASTTAQLLAASPGPPQPDTLTVARFLADDVPYDDRSFYAGITRLMPSHTILATEAGTRTDRYWDVTEVEERPIDPADVPDLFREHLTDAVRRRLSGSTRTVSHLSGGLDSPSIAASAQLLTPHELDPTAFITVSAIVPGPESDESVWIEGIVAGQPFEHRDFVPRIGPIGDYAEDMAVTGMPHAHHVRDLATRTAEIATEVGADLVLTGNGGDDVADDRWVLTEQLRTGRVGPWARSLRAMGADSAGMATLWGVSSLGLALPQPIKRVLRPLVRSGDGTSPLLSDQLRSALADDRANRDAAHTAMTPFARGLRNGRGLLLLEHQEAIFASHGLEVSHPFWDRAVIEFVASIPVAARTVGLGNKALIRSAYRDLLPESVITRTAKTLGNARIEEVMSRQAPQFTERFPAVTDRAQPYLDPAQYVAAITPADPGGGGSHVDADLWSAWSLMAWLEAQP